MPPIPHILSEIGNTAQLSTQSTAMYTVNNGFSITLDSVPATCWSNHTQVEPARVPRGCRHGHSICQQTNQWKGWPPSLSEGVMDVGGGGSSRREGMFCTATAGWHRPQNGKILKSQCRRLEERNPRGGEGSLAAYHPHITWTCQSPVPTPSAQRWYHECQVHLLRNGYLAATILLALGICGCKLCITIKSSVYHECESLINKSRQN